MASRAAFLLRGIAQDHPFADGNKRTAFEAADNMLRLNGAFVDADGETVVRSMLAVARGEVDVAAIGDWLRTHLRKLQTPRACMPGHAAAAAGPTRQALPPQGPPGFRGELPEDRDAIERLAKL